MTRTNRPTSPTIEAVRLSGPLQPQLVLLLDALADDADAATAGARESLARRIHAALECDGDEFLIRLAETITRSDRALLLELADRHERRTAPAPFADPAERLRRLEPARRYRDAAQVLSMLEELASA